MKNDTTYLRHVLDAIEQIEEFIHGMTFEDLCKDAKTLNAVVRELEIIGEATAHLSSDFQKNHPQIPFPNIVGMRNKLIHEYFDVDVEEVWRTCQKDLPSLKTMIDSILKE